MESTEQRSKYARISFWAVIVEFAAFLASFVTPKWFMWVWVPLILASIAVGLWAIWKEFEVKRDETVA